MAHTQPGWQNARHLRAIGERLASRIARGRARVAISTPPGHGKSTLISKGTPCWVESIWPEWLTLFTSYGDEYASEWGAATRDHLLAHPEIGVTIRKGAAASARGWRTREGGGMKTTGIGGPLTGRRGQLLLCDDPIKNAEEAFSQTVREAHWKWWQTTARTRLEPGASVVVIMTRWHPNDLVGKLLDLSREGGEPWEFWNFPAIAEENDLLGRAPGEPLWPERWPLEELDAARRAVGSLTWSAMYQGRPLVGEGKLFQRSWFAIIERDQLPTALRKVRRWDLAGTEADKGTDPDFTSGCHMGARDGKFYVLDDVTFRAGAEELERRLRQTAVADGRETSIRIELEGGAMAKLYLEHLCRRVLAGFDVKGETVARRGDKEFRARPFAAAAENKLVSLVRGPWIANWLGELEAFPTPGVHDDRVDAASGAYSFLATGPRWPWKRSGGRGTTGDDDENPALPWRSAAKPDDRGPRPTYNPREW